MLKTTSTKIALLAVSLLSQTACDDERPKFHWEPPPELLSCVAPPNDGAGGQCIEGRADPPPTESGDEPHDEVVEIRPP